MRIACILFLFITIAAARANAQSYGKHMADEPYRDTIITVFEDNNDSTVYTAIQRIISGVQPISYVSPLLLRFWPKERILPLRFGEGQKGYILEAGLDQSFTLAQGRSQMDHFAQTSRLSFRYAPAIRLTMDNSSNILPTNQKVGLQIDKVIWDSYTGNFFADRRHDRFEYADDIKWLREPHDLHMLNFMINAMHFSNGQAEGVYASVADSLRGRNDYLKGDFSTNFLNFTLLYSYYNIYLLTAAIGYQQEGDWGGPFAFIDEQRNRYGKRRITGFLQYRSRPVRNIFRKSITVKDIYHQRSYEVRRLWEHRIRLDFDYITGSLARFNRSKDYRLNTNLFYELNPLRSRTAGFTIHLFYGRDYMNIRYDDIIFAAMAGITFTLNKYRHPRFNPNQYILKEIGNARFEKIRQENTQWKLKY